MAGKLNHVFDSNLLVVSVSLGITRAQLSRVFRKGLSMQRAIVGTHAPAVTTASSFLPEEIVMPIFCSMKVTWKLFGLSSPPKLSLSLSNKPITAVVRVGARTIPKKEKKKMRRN